MSILFQAFLSRVSRVSLSTCARTPRLQPLRFVYLKNSYLLFKERHALHVQLRKIELQPIEIEITPTEITIAEFLFVGNVKFSMFPETFQRDFCGETTGSQMIPSLN